MKSRYCTSLALSAEDVEKINQLKQMKLSISFVDIFRKGLKEILKEGKKKEK